MSVKPDFATGWPDSFSKRAIPADKMIAQRLTSGFLNLCYLQEADLETNFNDMIKLGEIFGVKSKAEEWVAGQRKTLAAIKEIS